MVPCDSSLLVLASLPVLCLGQAVHTQEGLLPKPSIKAKPGSVVLWGQPATIVCRGPAGADTFRLEEKNRKTDLWDPTGTVHVDLHWAEATFHIDSVNESTTGSYVCLYRKGPSWSERSDILELKGADEDVFPPPSVPGTTPEVTPPPTGPVSQTAPESQNYMVGNYVRIGLAAVVLLILVAILAEAGHSWHRWPHRPQGWTQETPARKTSPQATRKDLPSTNRSH